MIATFGENIHRMDERKNKRIYLGGYMSITFHEPNVVDNLKKILDNTCKKISNGEEEEISEYFCTCGYLQIEDKKSALTVRSVSCGF